jgi:hypothetical protein
VYNNYSFNVHIRIFIKKLCGGMPNKQASSARPPTVVRNNEDDYFFPIKKGLGVPHTNFLAVSGAGPFSFMILS